MNGMRFDLTVNILTNHAVNKGIITVFGGAQKRPNIHIEDITDLYVELLETPAELIAGEAFNAGYENHTVAQLAEFVMAVIVGRQFADRREKAEIAVLSQRRRVWPLKHFDEAVRSRLGGQRR